MTLDDMRAELKRWQFMSGWTLEMIGGDGWGKYLVITATVRDSHRPDQWTVIRSSTRFPPCVDESDFGAHLRHFVHRMMTHEVDEWLERDCIKVFDPHRKEQD